MYSYDIIDCLFSSNFHKPIVCELNRYHHNTPAPNSYTVSDVIAKNGLITAHAAFKSRTPRQHSFFHTLSTPGPGQYDVEPDSTSDWNNGHQAVFQSNTKRHLLSHGEGPGPADYTPLLSQQHHSQPVCRKHRHYLCISAPAIPLPPQHPTPGPGHYETQRSSEVKSRLVSGAVFKSTTSRWGQHSTYKIQPGPGMLGNFPGKLSYSSIVFWWGCLGGNFSSVYYQLDSL